MLEGCFSILSRKPKSFHFGIHVAIRSNLPANMLQVLQFEDTKKFANELNNASKLSTNQGSMIELIAYADFCQGKTELSLKNLSSCFKLAQIIGRKRTWDQVILSSTISFIQHKFKNSLVSLKPQPNYSDPKHAWDTGRRLLLTLNYIELDWLDQAESEIAALKTHLQRTKKETEVRPRDEVILRVLQQLVKRNFDAAATVEANPEFMQQLHSVEDGCRWEVRTHEMIVFHHWLLDKAAGVDYAFRIPEEVVAWNEAKRQEFEAKKAAGTLWDDLDLGIEPEVLNRLLEVE